MLVQCKDKRGGILRKETKETMVYVLSDNEKEIYQSEVIIYMKYLLTYASSINNILHFPSSPVAIFSNANTARERPFYFFAFKISKTFVFTPFGSLHGSR